MIKSERKMKHYFDQAPRRSGISAWGTLLLLLGGLAVGGCAGGGGAGGSVYGGGASAPSVGPQSSTQYGDTGDAVLGDDVVRIDAIVPVFDPNIPEDSDTWEKKGVYPELRRAEANRFALKMKAALEDTNAFGTVRVVPDATATGDLYVIGKILESNGEDVRINISVTDISGRQWLSKDFKHRVKEAFHDDIRNKGKDSYEPLFAEAAAHIVKQLKRRKSDDLERLRQITELRFGSSLSEENFGRYLKVQNGRVELAAAPADDDPMLQRIQPIRVRDQLFMDDMQTYYGDFDRKMNDSYLVWQQQSMVEVKAARQAKRKAVAQSILGGLLLVAGAAAALEGSDDPNTFDTSAVVGGTAAAVIGGAVLNMGIQNWGEMKVHRDALAELGRSLDIEIAPQIVEYENQTAELKGNAAEQHAQWIEFLQRIYALEATPDKQL